MPETFDRSVGPQDFDSVSDYAHFRVREGMEGHEYDYADDVIEEWALRLIEAHEWNPLRNWMNWSQDELNDFFDWWREIDSDAVLV